MLNSATSRAPNSQATPARPKDCSSLAITISGSHWVGSHDDVANELTEPGCHSDQWSRNSAPKRRWK